jgi:hypothetical protein
MNALRFSYIMQEELLEIVEEVREQCLRDIGFSEDSKNTERQLLLGRCLSNCTALKSALEERGFSAEIGGGVLQSDAWRKVSTIGSFEAAVKNDEPIHYWVRVDGYICEVASECYEYPVTQLLLMNTQNS